jgi:tRNA modification GTPase
MENVLNTVAGIFRKDGTICAIATPAGSGAIAVIRISGSKTFDILSQLFVPASKEFSFQDAGSHTLHLGKIIYQEKIIDEVLLSIFRNPRSYTGEDVAEISCHGSVYIQRELTEALLGSGARLAMPGEFTLRAFLNGKLDLSQAEAVADLIASHSKTAHDLAIKQMRGGYSSDIQQLRQKLVDFASLIELELDFSEEDVEFADRTQFLTLLSSIADALSKMIDSFSLGNVLKTGIPVAIVGKPNVGKSTLLNALLNEEKAIVSDIPGTTRDSIEDTIAIDGLTFRFIDTAGLRQSEDTIESMGIERTWEKINQARIILYVIDVSLTGKKDVSEALNQFREYISNPDKKFILVANKTDMLGETPRHFAEFVELETVFVSAKRRQNLHLLASALVKSVNLKQITDESIVSSSRHYEALSKALEAINRVQEGMQASIPSDLLTVDIHTALHFLGEITGQVTNDELLGNIFGKFCIGK